MLVFINMKSSCKKNLIVQIVVIFKIQIYHKIKDIVIIASAWISIRSDLNDNLERTGPF